MTGMAPAWDTIITPRRIRRRTRAGSLSALGVILVLLGAMLLTLPVTVSLLATPAPTTHAITGGGEDTVMLERAAAWDRRLLDQGATAIGEGADPFSDRDSTPAYETDEDYQSQLDPGMDMASIRIPRIGVNLPIGHGTGDNTLRSGAGHMYGTTLPVGDPGNTVIAAHRGLGATLLFYRLGELATGDMIYTTAAGRTVAWKIDRISRVTPGSDEERDALKADGEHTRLTLYTCDPPGLNTRRLLVRAHRIPYEDATTKGQTDPWPPILAAALTGTTALAMALLATPRERIMRHAGRRR